MSAEPLDLLAAVRAAAAAAGVDLSGLVTEDELHGPPRCAGGCGAVVARWSSACAACDADRVAKEHAEAVEKAWSRKDGGVPEKLQWAALDHPSFARKVRDAAARQKVRDIAARLEQRPLVTIVGPSRAGKTTLACMLLREWVRRGMADDASPRAKHMARNIRFAMAQAIIDARATTRLGEYVRDLHLAYNASVLVLDECGRGKDTHKCIFSVVFHRHSLGLPTIVTTPCLSAAALADETGDGGLAARVFDEGERVEVRSVAGIEGVPGWQIGEDDSSVGRATGVRRSA